MDRKRHIQGHSLANDQDFDREKIDRDINLRTMVILILFAFK